MSGKFAVIKYNEKRELYWISWGGETFYDSVTRIMFEFDTSDQAAEWLSENYPYLTLVDEYKVNEQQTWIVTKGDDGQLRMEI